MIIGYLQTSPQFGEKEVNFAQIRSLASGLKADLLVLPELFATGYTFTSRDEALQLAEDSDGLTVRFLRELSADTGAVLVGGWVEQAGDCLFNSAVMVYAGQIIGNYRKIHLFNREKLWFCPGDQSPEVYDVKGMRIGMMICFDWIFPEVARTLALKGAQVIAHPSNLVLPWCQTAMVTRCLENRVFAVTANRAGPEERGGDAFHFTGRSQITGMNGDVLAAGPLEGTATGIIDIDLSLADSKSINPFNDLFRDRREELYFS